MSGKPVEPEPRSSGIERNKLKFQPTENSGSQQEICTLTDFSNINGDRRPYAEVIIGETKIMGLLDSGSNCTVLGKGSEVIMKDLELQQTEIKSSIKTADGSPHKIQATVKVPVSYAGQCHVINAFLVPTLNKPLILGIDFWEKFDINLVIGEVVMEDEEEEPIIPVEGSHDLTPEQAAMLQEAVSGFQFSSLDRLGYTTLIEHPIETGEAIPIKQKSYIVSPYIQKEIDKEIDRMIALDVIEPATSPWNNPMVTVRKPSGKIRMCIDARKLNEVTIKEAYPLPNINRILGLLRHTKFLSSIDLSDAFWQIKLRKKDRPKTAFAISGRGFFMFKRMPFGLVNSAATLCKLVDMVIGCDLEPYVFRYLDDFIIATETFEEHIRILKIIAERLREAGLTVSAEKSRFCMRTLTYVGYIVNEGGISADKSKISAIVEYPAPSNVRETRRLVGMASWYRRFIENFATIIAPITELIKSNSKNKFIWTEAAQKAFEEIIERLVSTPILANPDFSKEFIIQTDASDVGVGAVLVQGEGLDERVIAYFSKKLTKASQKYQVTERECLAVILAVEKFRPYIEGTSFKVITDHASLCWLQNLKDPVGRLARWALRLQPYDMKLIHRPGKQMVVADALSRAIAVIDFKSLSEEKESWYFKLKENVVKYPNENPNYSVVNDILYRYCARGPNEFDPTWKVVIPENERNTIMYECHDSIQSAHGGFYKTLQRIQRSYYWPEMKHDIRKYVQNCSVCKMTKPTNKIQRAPMGKNRDSNTPWRQIALDFIGPFPLSKNGHRWLLVVVDTFSKYVVLAPLRQATAEKTILMLKEQIFTKFGVPEIIILDNVSQLRSNLFKECAKTYGIKLWYTANYHPQANPTEAANQTIITAIRAYIKDPKSHRTWDVELHQLACALNSSVHTATGFTPYKILYGEEIVTNGKFHELMLDPEIPENDRASWIHNIRVRAQTHLREAYENRKKRYNLRARKIEYKVGDVVYKKNFKLSDASQYYMAKLDKKFSPVRIKEKIGTNCYRLEDLNGNEFPGTYSTSELKE